MENNILLIQIIFINNNNTFCRWRNSFNSININNDIKLLISGYVSDRYISLVKKSISNVDYKFYNENIGKSSIINNIVEDTLYETFNIHIFMDSDIILESNTISVLCSLFLKNNFSILLPNHKDDIRHNIKNITEKVIIDGYSILYNNIYNSNSFAGGLFITNRDVLQKNKFEMLGTYGPDDTYFFKKIYDTKDDSIKYKIGLIENIFVIHPYDNDTEYNKFKLDKLFKHLNTKSL
jgi:hypothetical protein